MSDAVGSCEEPRGTATPRESLAETLREGPSRSRTKVREEAHAARGVTRSPTLPWNRGLV